VRSILSVRHAREEQVLQLLLVGFSTRQIARELEIDVATVKAVLREILRTVKAGSETPRLVDALPPATQ
jgi:DNA-binding NarL/FixJ family response regulator